MIQLLDCSLRDGAHVNSGCFGFENIIQIADNLTKASLDYIELGFLKNVVYDANTSFYPHIEDACNLLDKFEKNSNTEYALMARADEYDLNNLSECDERIKIIRVAFYYDFLDKAIKFAKEVMARGYRVTLNLINTPGNSIQALNKVINSANKINPYVITIVDTFGAMFVEDMIFILNEYDKKLHPNIKIGLHVHENRALAFALAQAFLKNISNNRDVIIDGSLSGIGRAPGNLPTELITDYLNTHYKKNYFLSPILKTISENILPIKNNFSWGYSPGYFLSAAFKVHRSYSEYLLKKGVRLDRIQALLKQIDEEHSGKFDKAYIDRIVFSSLQEGGNKF